MTAAALIRQDDLTRIFRAAKAANYPVSVRLAPDRTVVILPVSEADSVAPSGPSWDDEDEAVASDAR